MKYEKKSRIEGERVYILRHLIYKINWLLTFIAKRNYLEIIEIRG